MTQRERLLGFARWRGGEGFTRLDALEACGVFELAARISELERLGHRFDRERVTVKNRWGDRCIVTRYTIRDEEVVA